jgi:hypothetical protein
LEFPREKIVIFVIADRKGSEQVEPWVQALYETYVDAVDIEGIALVTGVPKLLRGTVREIFERALEEKPVLLDWSGEVCSRFEYKRGSVELHIVNSKGLRIHSERGPINTDAFEKVCAAVDGTIEEVKEHE